MVTQLHAQRELAVTFMHQSAKWNHHVHFASCKICGLVICSFVKELEQKANEKFCIQPGKSVTETLSMLQQAYGDKSMGCMQCFNWHGCFKSGRMSLEDDKQSGRHATSVTPGNVKKINQLVVSLPCGPIQQKLTSELNMRHAIIKSVPCLLTTWQKEHHVEACQDLCQCATDDPSFLSRIISGNLSCVYRYDPGTKQQCTQWKSPSSPQLKKAQQRHSSIKSMHIDFSTSMVLCIRIHPPGHQLRVLL